MRGSSGDNPLQKAPLLAIMASKVWGLLPTMLWNKCDGIKIGQSSQTTVLSLLRLRGIRINVGEGMDVRGAR